MAGPRARRRARLVEQQSNRCFWCGREMAAADDEKNPRRATLEHIIPKDHGGSNAIENCAAACALCNYNRSLYGPRGRHWVDLSRTIEAMLAEFPDASFMIGYGPNNGHWAELYPETCPGVFAEHAKNLDAAVRAVTAKAVAGIDALQALASPPAQIPEPLEYASLDQNEAA